MTYAVKEVYFTLQGEGAQTGHAAVFLRFAGCNLWTGREADRARAVCDFCDTDFLGTDGPGGGKFATPGALADAVEAQWPTPKREARLVVCTGGEPALQLDAPLLDALHARGFRVAIETNGTQPLAPPERFTELRFTHFFLQPKDGPDRERNTEAAMRYCLANPRWRLSIQTHKMLGLP